ncbi:uncharacterized protein SCHCODRAFT_02750692 [Schizophyllum commune H4-8]|nr:uncharacterized protein SCHCODRAFT_02750692 [Schizophyllum commune H4-8]KAI5889066.1 hypothetical protein SCHCODRAFT_02750692 [Schizophyllum commune H4-8]
MKILQDSVHATQLCSKCSDSFSSHLQTAELVSLARSTHVPHTRAELSALSDKLSQTRNNLRSCDREMQRLRITLAELCEQRALIQSTEENLVALLSPVRKLPAEILAEIACYTLPPRWFEHPPGSLLWPFMHVCRAWREAVIGMRWPWAHIDLHAYHPSDKFATWTDASLVYLQRCGQYPLVLKIRAGIQHEVIQTALWPHARRIRELELQCPDGGSPFPRRLPALWRLWLTGPFGGTIHAPKLRILELFGCSMSRLNVPWVNLRVLRAAFDVREEDLEVLRECVRLEELSFSTWNWGEYFGSQPITLPALHTLEIGHGALRFCSQLDAPALRHFCLNFACNGLCKRPYEECEWFQDRDLMPVVNLVRPLTSLTVRNADGPTHNWSATRALRALLNGPRKLLEIIFILDEYTPSWRGSSFLQFFANAILWDQTPLPYLEELHILNRCGATWRACEVRNVRDLLEVRSTPAASHGRQSGLKRLRIYTPRAEFPASALEESWANMRRTDGERILVVDTRE